MIAGLTIGDTVALGFAAFAVISFVIAAFAAERHYRGLLALPALSEPPAQQMSSVQILIPARNESANIERVVASLVALDYPVFKVTVIDDHSADDTAAKARRAGADVLSLRAEPPPGWTGKCNACEQGVRATESDWLLFTDADTCHTPGSLSRTVAFAEKGGLDALSLLLRQECIGFWERVVLPIAYQQFFAVLRPGKPAFNGQYILIRRAVYEASGGFSAVRGRVMEDVALAESLAGWGFKTALLNGHNAASVRMYLSLPALFRGMTKTAFAAARDRGLFGVLLGGLTFLGLFTVLLGIYGILSGSSIALTSFMLIMLVNIFWCVPWLRRFHVPPLYAGFNLLGISFLWVVGMVSTFRVITGNGVRWKGRTIIERRSGL